MLHNLEARGLRVGDEVRIVGNWWRNGEAIYTFAGVIEQGEPDPQGNVVPEDMMWFVNHELGKVCPVPVGYIYGFPCEDDLSFEKVITN